MTSAVSTLVVKPEEAGLRLDRWFKGRFPSLGHARLEKLLRTGQVRLDGKRAKAGVRLKGGESVRIPPLEGGVTAPAETRPLREISAKDARFVEGLVLYRDEELLALDKPAGLAVQGGSGSERHLDGMLDALRFGREERPRLVHRLDRDTSGVLLLARNAASARALAETFRRRSTRKLYWALTVGVPRPFQGKLDLPLAKLPGKAGERMAPDAAQGKRALTYYRVLEHAGRKLAWVALWPVTGRTHQLRVHMAALGTPILGDGKYGGKAAFLKGEGVAQKLHLHARALTIPHPKSRRPLTITAPLPPHMRASWRLFGFDAERQDDPFVGLAI